MIGWLYNLIVGNFCHHQWKIIKEISVYTYAGDTLPHTHRLVIQCEKCGKISKREV